MGKILVIDDELAILTFCKALFAASHHQVFIAAEAKDGLAVLEKEKPDLVILDLNMPGENGLALLPKIKSKMPKLPVIIFSGFLDSEIEKAAFSAGAADVIPKGGSPQELSAKVEKILAGGTGAQSSRSKIEKILIVDDEETIRSFLVAFLRDKGFETLEAKNGQEAIAVVRKEKPTLMLLDVNMPGMDGIETLRKIREFDKDIGVVMATANQDEVMAKEAAELGSYQYVLKPFDLKYLELVVLTRLLMA